MSLDLRAIFHKMGSFDAYKGSYLFGRQTSKNPDLFFRYRPRDRDQKRGPKDGECSNNCVN
jgi:hypothetical protein